MAAIPAYIPNLLPSINPSPQPVVKLGHAVFSEVDGLDKVFKCAKSAIDFLSALTPSLPAYLPILGSLVKGAGEVIMPFQFFKVAKEWTEINKKNFAGKASLVGLTAVATIGIGRFLEKIQLFNMTAAVSKLGNVPVLGHIVNVPFGVLTASVAAFNALDAGIKLRKVIRPFGIADRANVKVAKWEARQQAVAAFDKTSIATASENVEFQAIPNWNLSGLGVGYSKKANVANLAAFEAAIKASNEVDNPQAAQTAGKIAAEQVKTRSAEERVALIGHKSKLLLNSHPNVAPNTPDAMDAVNAYTAYKVRHWRAEVDNAKTDTRKAYFTLASEISKFALIVLGLIGASFSIAALAVSSLPMLTFGLIVAGIAVAKKVYDTRHKEAYVMAHPDQFESAVIAKYRVLKTIAKKERTGEV